MIRYDKHKRKDGIKTQVRVVEGYRVDGKIKQKTIKDFGYLEDQVNQDEFIVLVKKFDEDYKKNKLLLKYIYPKMYKKITNWSYLGNDILNKIIDTEDKCLKLDRDKLHTMPEFEHAKSFNKPVRIYKNFYFKHDYSDFALENNGGIILLHNSWTPEEYKKMSREEFLKTNNTLAKILQKIL